MKAYWKNLRISPKKLRVIAEVVKWNDASEALNFLKFAPKKWAKLLHWVLKSAVFNAVNNDSQKLELWLFQKEWFLKDEIQFQSEECILY